MTTRHMISPGIGFSPGGVGFMITRGLNTGFMPSTSYLHPHRGQLNPAGMRDPNGNPRARRQSAATGLETAYTSTVTISELNDDWVWAETESGASIKVAKPPTLRLGAVVDPEYAVGDVLVASRPQNGTDLEDVQWMDLNIDGRRRTGIAPYGVLDITLPQFDVQIAGEAATPIDGELDITIPQFQVEFEGGASTDYYVLFPGDYISSVAEDETGSDADHDVYDSIDELVASADDATWMQIPNNAAGTQSIFPLTDGAGALEHVLIVKLLVRGKNPQPLTDLIFSMGLYGTPGMGYSTGGFHETLQPAIGTSWGNAEAAWLTIKRGLNDMGEDEADFMNNIRLEITNSGGGSSFHKQYLSAVEIRVYYY